MKSKSNEEYTKKTVEILEKQNMPLSVGFVAFHLNVTWQTARSLLLKLSLNGKIDAIETSKGMLFSAKAGKSEKVSS